MAETRVASGLELKKWNKEFNTNYFQENRFKDDMGTSENAIIQVNRELSGGGKQITFALANRMTGAGVTGRVSMKGNEEALSTRSFDITVTKRRNAFTLRELDSQYSAVDLEKVGRTVLMDWAMEDDRDRIIEAMGSINGVAYASASEAQKDAWLVDNTDRVLFGAAKSNHGSDHSAALANIDNSADKLTSAAASLMKRIALSANPKIRPVRSESSGRRYFVCYCGPLTFRDIKADSTIVQAQRDVSLRMQNEKLFNGGDIEWDGIIFKEIDDIPSYAGVGAGGIQVAPVFFCGAQAVGYAIARDWRRANDEDDYGDLQGMEVSQIANFEKMRYGTGTADTDDPKDHGMVTGWFASVADA